MKDTELYRVLLGLKEPWQIEAVALSEAEETITVRVGLPPNTPLNLPPTYQRREFEDLRNSNLRNARAEGINNKIQTIKKKAYGFRSIPRFINAIYFHCAGLRLHPL
jgi:hypothetical protein